MGLLVMNNATVNSGTLLMHSSESNICFNCLQYLRIKLQQGENNVEGHIMSLVCPAETKGCYTHFQYQIPIILMFKQFSA